MTPAARAAGRPGHGLGRRAALPLLPLLAALAAALVGPAGCKDHGGARRAPAPPAARDGASPAAARDAGRPADAARAGQVTPPTEQVVLPPASPVAPAPRGLPPTPSPSHNPITAEKVELGRLLFFQKALSSTGAMSCASCHRPHHGWASPAPRDRTAAGQLNLRHTPSLWNAGYQREWAWDGSMPSLEAQTLGHLRGQLGQSPDQVVTMLIRTPAYAARFERAFGDPPTRDHLAETLAAFVRTLRSGDAPWDQHEAEVPNAVTLPAIAGAEVFSRRAGCASCHPPPLYTDLGYHDRGVSPADRGIDPGRMRVTTDPRDRGAFKTPTLRGAVYTAPYFHDGSAATLDQAIDAELERSGVRLLPEEKTQLVEFVRSLSPAVRRRPTPQVPPIAPAGG